MTTAATIKGDKIEAQAFIRSFDTNRLGSLPGVVTRRSIERIQSLSPASVLASFAAPSSWSNRARCLPTAARSSGSAAATQSALVIPSPPIALSLIVYEA